MSLSQPSEAVGKPVNHNVAAGSDPAPCSLFLIFSIGIGHMNRLIKTAFRIAAVKHVMTLGSFVISLLLLCSYRGPSESHFVDAENFALRKQSQSVFALHYDNMVRFRRSDFRSQHPNQQHQDHRRSMYVLCLKC